MEQSVIFLEFEYVFVICVIIILILMYLFYVKYSYDKDLEGTKRSAVIPKRAVLIEKA